MKKTKKKKTIQGSFSMLGNVSIKAELGRKGFKIENGMLKRRGTYYKLPRPIQRAMNRGDLGVVGNFKLIEVGTTMFTSEVPVTPRPPFNQVLRMPKVVKAPFEDEDDEDFEDMDDYEFEDEEGEFEDDDFEDFDDDMDEEDLDEEEEPKVKKSPRTKVQYLLTDKAVSFYHKGQTHQTGSANPMFDTIVSMLRKGEVETAVELTNVAKAIDKASGGVITADGGILKHKGEELNETVNQWILRHMGKGHEAFNAVVNFLGRCKNNINQGSIQQLWQFIRANEFIIMPTGEFLAYKYVTDDLKDCHTNTFDNGIGQTVSMPRNDVTYDPQRTCAAGLHLARFEYVSGQSTIVEAVCCPSNVVSVPTDYNGAKLRCCAYTVHRLIRHKGQDVNERTTQEHFFPNGIN